MAMEPITLSKEDQKTLEDLAPDIERLTRELAKAVRAGLDVTELKAQFEKAKTLRDGVLREYGT